MAWDHLAHLRNLDKDSSCFKTITYLHDQALMRQ